MENWTLLPGKDLQQPVSGLWYKTLESLLLTWDAKAV